MEQNYFLRENILNRLKRDMLDQEMAGTTGFWNTYEFRFPPLCVIFSTQ